MYHRIADEACDPWGLCVTERQFDEQMAFLARHRAAVDLADFARDDAYSDEGARIAITFDDGYIDNVTRALPIIERHEIPATLFVVGSAIGRRREFWWDALQRALMESGPLPPVLPFPFGDGPQEYLLDEKPQDRAVEAGWRADETDAETNRQRLFLQLWEAIVVLTPAEQDDAVDHLLVWAGLPVAALADRLPATMEEFAPLLNHPLMRIGSHTLDHLSLPGLDDAAQREQIEVGHRRMEEMVGHRIDRFSYPFGRMDARAKAHVAALGVDVACTSVPMAATIRDDRRALPRLQVVDRDGDGFGRWLQDDHGLLTHVAMP